MRVGAVLLAVLLLASACREAETEVQPTPSPSASPASAARTSTADTRDLPVVGTIAYVGTDGFLWVRDADGERTRIYAPENGYVYYPEWSPDGTRIAFTEVAFTARGFGPGYNWADITSVVVVDLQGAELARLPRAILPHWSPDGQELSIGAEMEDVGERLFMVPYTVDVETGTSRKLLDRVSTLDSPRWTPDGSLLAYATLDGLYLIAADGESGPRRIVETDGRSLFYVAPVWFAEGRLLVYETNRTGGNAPVDSYVVIDRSGRVVSRVDDSNPAKCGRASFLREFEAHWVPGTSLAMWGIECHRDEEPAGIWVKEMLGGGAERFIDASSAVRSVGVLDVSADGSFIAFSNAGAGLGTGPGPFSYSGDSGRINIYLVSVEGGDPELLITDALQPAWQP